MATKMTDNFKLLASWKRFSNGAVVNSFTKHYKCTISMEY